MAKIKSQSLAQSLHKVTLKNKELKEPQEDEEQKVWYLSPTHQEGHGQHFFK